MPFIYNSNVTVTKPFRLNAIHLRLKSHSHMTFPTQCHAFTTQISQSQDLPDSKPLNSAPSFTVARTFRLNATHLRIKSHTGPSQLNATHLRLKCQRHRAIPTQSQSFTKKKESQKNFHCQEFLKSQNTTVINTFCVRLKIQILVGRAILSQIFLGPKWARL